MCALFPTHLTKQAYGLPVSIAKLVDTLSKNKSHHLPADYF